MNKTLNILGTIIFITALMVVAWTCIQAIAYRPWIKTPLARVAVEIERAGR